MPITKSAKKALRQSKKRKARNLRRLKAMKDIIKNIRKLVLENKKAAEGLPRGKAGESRSPRFAGEAGQGREETLKLLPQAYKLIDKAAKIGLIKKNNADRKKSRLTRLVNKGMSSAYAKASADGAKAPQ